MSKSIQQSPSLVLCDMGREEEDLALDLSVPFVLLPLRQIFP